MSVINYLHFSAIILMFFVVIISNMTSLCELNLISYSRLFGSLDSGSVIIKSDPHNIFINDGGFYIKSGGGKGILGGGGVGTGVGEGVGGVTVHGL